MATPGRDPRSTPSWKSTGAWLLFFLVLALTLRVVFAVGPAYDPDGERYLFSGNDPYYHGRTVEHILESGEHLSFDPIIRYPAGSINPNPPLYDWTTAPLAGVLQSTGMGETEAITLALNAMAALWGALVLIPVYVIAQTLFSRRAGLWAAFLMAVSAPHIERAMFGFADNEALMFFMIACTLAFLTKALAALRGGEYVGDWRSMDAVRGGIAEAVSRNREAFVWALLAGTALAGTAYVWKGYPYIVGILAAALGFQLLVDHARNRDSTPAFLVYMLVAALGNLLAYLLYYIHFPSLMSGTVEATLYITIGMLVAGIVLVPTRDLPSILVFPAVVVAAVVGMVLMLVVLPDVGRAVFGGAGYFFEQSRLFQTIAEAQRTDLGYVAAAFGFFMFMVAFWAFGIMVRRAFRGEAAPMLFAAWFAVALFLAFSAARFVSHAALAFAIAGGIASARLVSVFGWDRVFGKARTHHGRGAVAAGWNAMGWKPAVGAILLALCIILPNFWLGMDAGMPGEYIRDQGIDNRHLGAFGLGFGIKGGGWLDCLDHLAQKDTDLHRDDRPGFLAWWDYGHWATFVGQHPTVADPFQNNYFFAAQVLTSKSEEDAMGWLSLLMAYGDWTSNGGAYSQPVRALLDERAPGFTADPPSRTEASHIRLMDSLGDDLAADLYADLADASGKYVGYFAVDARMWPFSHQDIGIFHAPLFLSNKNPDDYLQILYTDGSGDFTLVEERYFVDERTGEVKRHGQPRQLFHTVDDFGNDTVVEYEVFGEQAFLKGRAAFGEQGIPVRAFLDRTDLFEQTFYARAYGSPAYEDHAGEGLRNWRIVQECDTELIRGQQRVAGRGVALLQHYRGVWVEGQAQDTLGRPMEGLTVTFEDSFGATHHENTTGADGTFRVLAPFSLFNQAGTGDLTMLVSDGPTVVTTSTEHQFTLEQARAGDTVTGVVVTLETSTLQGRVYQNVDGQPGFNETTDRPIEGAEVQIGDATYLTASDGTYLAEDLQSGRLSVTVTAPGWQTVSRTVDLPSGTDHTEDFILQPRSSTVTFNVSDDAGEPAGSVPFRVYRVDEAGDRIEAAAPQTDPDGLATATLAPAGYVAVFDHEFQEGPGTFRYDEEHFFEVPFGGDPLTLDWELARHLAGAPPGDDDGDGTSEDGDGSEG